MDGIPSNPREGSADLDHEQPKLKHVQGKERFARREECDRKRSLGVGPGDDVRETEVTEGVGRVRTEEAQKLAPKHEAKPIAQRQAEGQIQLPVRLLRGRVAYRAGLEDTHPVEFSLVQEALVEGRELFGRCDHVRRWDNARPESWIVRERHRLVKPDAKRTPQELREGRQDRRSRKGVAGDKWYVDGRHSIV